MEMGLTTDIEIDPAAPPETATIRVPLDVRLRGPAAAARYEKMIAAGESPTIAEMLAMQAAPASKTDDQFFNKFGTLREQLSGDERRMEILKRKADAQGIRLTGNEVYMAPLANETLDPKACFSRAGGVGAIKAYAEKTGAKCEGWFKTNPTEKEVKPKPIAKDLADRAIRGLARRDRKFASAHKSDQVSEVNRLFRYKEKGK